MEGGISSRAAAWAAFYRRSEAAIFLNLSFSFVVLGLPFPISQ